MKLHDLESSGKVSLLVDQRNRLISSDNHSIILGHLNRRKSAYCIHLNTLYIVGRIGEELIDMTVNTKVVASETNISWPLIGSV